MPARTTKVKIPGFTAYVGKVAKELSENTVRDIVIDLKIKGPYWSGEFEANWVVKRGNASVAASKESQFGDFPERKQRTITDITIPPATGKGNITYSIGNQMKYRDVALDLLPGRLGKSGNISYADQPAQDWYETYLQAELESRINKTTGKVANLPGIKNFKGGKA
jgi:hypothetical protein